MRCSIMAVGQFTCDDDSSKEDINLKLIIANYKIILQKQ